MIYVDFEDNGSGIPKGTLEKIFDPFYTTKGPEKGTGLGLAIVEAILHRHHASISVESQVDIGTKFTMAFPIQKDDEALPDTLPVG
jgi:signal transduction histidine kinase